MDPRRHNIPEYREPNVASSSHIKHAYGPCQVFSRAQPLSEAGESRLRKLDRARRSAVNSSASWILIVDWPKRSTRVQPRIAETMG